MSNGGQGEGDPPLAHLSLGRALTLVMGSCRLFVCTPMRILVGAVGAVGAGRIRLRGSRLRLCRSLVFCLLCLCRDVIGSIWQQFSAPSNRASDVSGDSLTTRWVLLRMYHTATYV